MAKPFTVMLSDAPWTFKTHSPKGGKKSPKYDCMTLDELRALAPTVKELAGKNGVHFMWTTFSQLENAIGLMTSWGYKYKTARVWFKSHRGGTGYWALCDAEVLLIGTRGKVRLPQGKKVRTIFEGRPLEKRHSSKPECIHSWLETGYPDQEKIELFARLQRPSWNCIGSDLGKLITPKGIMQCQPATNLCKSSTKSGKPTQEATCAL